VWIDNAFQRRLAHPLERALIDRSRHVIGAVSGAGKTTAMVALERRHPIVKHPDGRTEAPVLIAVSTTEDELSRGALVRRLIRPLGDVPRLPIGALEDWLIDQIGEVGTRLLVFDDAQDFGLRELRHIKKLIDRIQHELKVEIGVCLLVASEGSAIPLRDQLVGASNDTYRQFRRRFSSERPWLYVPALSAAELPEVLAGFEVVFSDRVPGLRLEPWSERIFRHLSVPYFDPYATGRVTLASVQNVVVAVVSRLRDDARIEARLIDDVAEALATGLRVATVEEQWAASQ
jgi:hypothetical protein